MFDGDTNDYDMLKKALSTRYNLTEDGYRKRFREVKPARDRGNARPVRHPFEELPSQVVRTFWKQFLRLGRPNGSDSQETVYQRLFWSMSLYLFQRGPKDLVKLTTWAQQYLIAHKQQQDARPSLQSSLNVPNKGNQIKWKLQEEQFERINQQ